MIQNHQSIPFNEAPVFVTKDERDLYEAIESKGAEYILQKCKSMIDSIDNDEDRDDFGDDYKVAAKPSTKKQAVLQLYYILAEYIALQERDLEIALHDSEDLE